MILDRLNAYDSKAVCRPAGTGYHHVILNPAFVLFPLRPMRGSILDIRLKNVPWRDVAQVAGSACGMLCCCLPEIA